MSDRPVAELAGHWARYPIIWSPRVSGDGKWLAWTWTGLSDTGEIWFMPTDGSTLPQRLTHGHDHFQARSLSHDGACLVLAQSIGGDEHDRLFLLDRRKPDALQPLTPVQSENYVFGGVLGRDARDLFYSADFDYETRGAAEGSRIHRLDLATDARQVLARAESVSEFEPELSPNETLILYSRCDRHAAGNQIWVVGRDGSGDREIINAGDRFKLSAHWLGRDHRLLVQAETATHERVGTFDLDTGKTCWLIDDPARCIEGIAAGQDGRVAMVLEYVQGRLAAKLLDVESGEERPFAVPGSNLQPIAQLGNGDWICESYSSHAPHDLVRVDPETMQVTNLSRAAGHFSGIDFHSARELHWKSTDGMGIQGWLYEPATTPSRGLIVWVHGGPTWHSEDRVNPIIQFLTGAGFTVLDPNYRGSTGFGTAFREAIKTDGWGGREQDDIRSGIEALIAAGKAKRGRIGVAGLSYGGYSSWVAITRFADLVDAAVPICGMYQLDVDYHATGMPHGRAYSIEMMGGAPEQMPERYFKASPANFIRNIRGKILIVHGLADSNVSPENTRLACRDLSAAGIPYELLTFPDEGHGIYKVGNRERLLLTMERFFDAAFV